MHHVPLVPESHLAPNLRSKDYIVEKKIENPQHTPRHTFACSTKPRKIYANSTLFKSTYNNFAMLTQCLTGPIKRFLRASFCLRSKPIHLAYWNKTKIITYVSHPQKLHSPTAHSTFPMIPGWKLQANRCMFTLPQRSHDFHVCFSDFIIS